jgi:hypothetical protein
MAKAKTLEEMMRQIRASQEEERKTKDKPRLPPAAEREVFPSGDLEEPMPKRRVQKKAKGGKVKSSASKRGDGIAQRGKTRGKMI